MVFPQIVGVGVMASGWFSQGVRNLDPSRAQFTAGFALLWEPKAAADPTGGGARAIIEWWGAAVNAGEQVKLACLSLSDVLHLVRQSLGPPYHFKCHYSVPSYDWAVFSLTYVPHLLHSLLCHRTSRLLPCPGYHKQCCNEYWGRMYLFKLWFSLNIHPAVGLLDHK